MCIRDSPKGAVLDESREAVGQRQEEQQARMVVKHHFMQRLRGGDGDGHEVLAVSYTHLDVYKRQNLEHVGAHVELVTLGEVGGLLLQDRKSTL